jgi:hypothetical protein
MKINKFSEKLSNQTNICYIPFLYLYTNRIGCVSIPLHSWHFERRCLYCHAVCWFATTSKRWHKLHPSHDIFILHLLWLVYINKRGKPVSKATKVFSISTFSSVFARLQLSFHKYKERNTFWKCLEKYTLYLCSSHTDMLPVWFFCLLYRQVTLAGYRIFSNILAVAIWMWAQQLYGISASLQ